MDRDRIMNPHIHRPAHAIFSQDRRYRYKLTRSLSHPMYEGERPALFIMLNPSTADENLNDPTIRRCLGFAMEWKCTDLWVVNLFAYRATNPRELNVVEDPVGPENHLHIMHAMHDCARRSTIVAAWGAHPMAREAGKKLMEQFGGVIGCLGRTASGAPRHPLYVRANTQLEPYAYSR